MFVVKLQMAEKSLLAARKKLDTTLVITYIADVSEYLLIDYGPSNNKKR